MPPKKKGGKGAKGSKKAARETSPEPATGDPNIQESDDGGYAEDEREDDQRSVSEAGSESTVDTDQIFNEKIADFFEDHRHFYDMTHSDYKNKQRRNFELQEFAGVLGHDWTPDSIWKRFVSLRTDYGKLKALIQKGKSGSAPVKWTPKQKWKLQRLQFLNPYIKRGTGPSGIPEEMGKVSISQIIN